MRLRVDGSAGWVQLTYVPLLRRIGTREQALATVDACGRLAWVLATAGALLLALPEVAASPVAVTVGLVAQLAIFGVLGYLLRRFRHHLLAALLLALSGLACLGALTAFASHWAESAGPFAEVSDLLGLFVYLVLLWAATRASEATVKLRGRFSAAWQQANPDFSLFSRIETRGQACAVIDDSARGFMLLQVVGLFAACKAVVHGGGDGFGAALLVAIGVSVIAHLMRRFRSRLAAVALLVYVCAALFGVLVNLRGAMGHGFLSGLLSLAVAGFLVFVGVRALEATLRLARGLPEAV